MIRTLQERIIQSVAYEFFGLIIVLPGFAYYTGVSISDSLILLFALSLLLTLWAGIHNSIFDWLEWNLFETLASDRSIRCRAFHAVSLEFSSVLVSVPAFLLLTDMTFLDAIVADIALSIAYVIYGFLFQYGYDYFRPVQIGV